MIKRNFIGVSAAICLILAGGCGAKQDNVKNDAVSQTGTMEVEVTKAPEAVTDDGDSEEIYTDTAEYGDFRVTHTNYLTADPSGEYSNMFSYRGNEDVTILITDNQLSGICSEECFAAYMEDTAMTPEGEELREIGGRKVWFKSTKQMENGDDEDYFTQYTLHEGKSILLLTVTHPKSMSAEIEATAEMLIRSVEFTGNTALPTETRTLEWNNITLEAEPKWSTVDAEDADNEMIVRYSYAEDLAHLYSSLSVVKESEDKYVTAVTLDDAADMYYNRLLETGMGIYYNVTEPEVTALGDIDSRRISYDIDSGNGMCLDMWLFMTDEGLMSVQVLTCKYDGWETVRQEFAELAEHIALK